MGELFMSIFKKFKLFCKEKFQNIIFEFIFKCTPLASIIAFIKYELEETTNSCVTIRECTSMITHSHLFFALIAFVLMWLYIITMKRCFLKKKKKDELHIMLCEIYAEGENLYKATPSCGDEYGIWEENFANWFIESKEKIRKYFEPTTLITFISIIDENKVKELGYYCNISHGQNKKKLYCYLTNIRNLINTTNNLYEDNK